MMLSVVVVGQAKKIIKFSFARVKLCHFDFNSAARNNFFFLQSNVVVVVFRKKIIIKYVFSQNWNFSSYFAAMLFAFFQFIFSLLCCKSI